VTPGTIRELQLRDTPVVVALLRESFEPDLWPLMTYTQHGAAEYLSVPLRFPDFTPAARSLVMLNDDGTGSVFGFADFRVLGADAAHLSYICVAPEARGRGVATALIREFLTTHPSVTRLSLDVFNDNVPARSLYAKLGFDMSDSSVWITRPLPRASGSVTVDNLPFALAAYSSYGFCELQVNGGFGIRRYGLLGRATVRAFTAESFDDDEVFAGLHALFADTTTAFCIVPDAELGLIQSEHSLVKRNDRMILSWSLDSLPPLGNK
jgi:ribosomal protein S18 acetylase RimI-like enzyme